MLDLPFYKKYWRPDISLCLSCLLLHWARYFFNKINIWQSLEKPGLFNDTSDILKPFPESTKTLFTVCPLHYKNIFLTLFTSCDPASSLKDRLRNVSTLPDLYNMNSNVYISTSITLSYFSKFCIFKQKKHVFSFLCGSKWVKHLLIPTWNYCHTIKNHFNVSQTEYFLIQIV